jgi:hypothetical protein
MTTHQSIIKQVDELDLLSPDIIVKLLRKNGFRKLGHGVYSVTYGRSDLPYVVKVNKASDPAAYKFYSMIAGKKSTKYFPKVHALKAYVTDSGNFKFIVVMERLHRLTRRNWKQVNESGRGFVSWLSLHPEAIMDISTDEKEGLQWGTKNKASIEIVSSLIASTKQFAGIDFHDDNVMVRMPQGDAVLVDPVCTC